MNKLFIPFLILLILTAGCLGENTTENDALVNQSAHVISPKVTQIVIPAPHPGGTIIPAATRTPAQTIRPAPAPTITALTKVNITQIRLQCAQGIGTQVLCHRYGARLAKK